MRVLDLFSGIGGFSLGLEAAGMHTVAFCEREPFCQAVLKKHWPNVPCHDDVTTFNGKPYNGAIDVICGGFPCQDISLAGKGGGLLAKEADSGQNIFASSKKSDPSISSSKTYRPFALADWERYSGHSLRSGMMLNGIVSPLLPLAPLTDETEYGLWPTPKANDPQKRGNFDVFNPRNGLPAAVKLWPTPTSSDNRDRGCMQDTCVQRRVALGKQIGLSTAVKLTTQAGTLNPMWVEWLMGYPCGYTDLQPSETALFLKLHKLSGKQSCKKV